MENIIKKIREYRKEKGFSYESMAHDLNISPASYRKIEHNETKLSVERLFQIAKALDIKVEKLLGLQTDKFYNQEFKDNSINYQEFQNLHQENKEQSQKIIELYEKRLVEKDEMINFLKQQNQKQ